MGHTMLFASLGTRVKSDSSKMRLAKKIESMIWLKDHQNSMPFPNYVLSVWISHWILLPFQMLLGNISMCS